MPAAGDQSGKAKFVTGSIMRHVVVMTATGSLGLMAVFVVDALNLFYISLLGQQELAAAIGFAGTLQFFLMSFAIGFTIAASALVSRALGQERRSEAAANGGASLIYMVAITALIVGVSWPFLDDLTGLLGATGRTRELAVHYLQIVTPSMVVMAVGMGASGILRGVGDARRAMYVTLAGGFAAAILDPIFIFALDLDLTGAAIANVLSRFVLAAVGLHGAYHVHRLVAFPNRQRLADALKPFMRIGIPAVLTQLATPFGNAYVTAAIAQYGDEAVAGWAVIGRLVPLAFGGIFALSGAVGPIIGQNHGAGLNDRVTRVLRDSLILTIIYVLAVWAVLALTRNVIGDIFNAGPDAQKLISFFCLFAAGSFLFNGALFVANAAFNNLGYATYSTLFNWGRSTLGVIPFVWAGSKYYGVEGVIAGWGLGAVVFGIASVHTCFRILKRMEAGGGDHDRPDLTPPSAAQSPFSSGKASTLG